MDESEKFFSNREKNGVAVFPFISNDSASRCKVGIEKNFILSHQEKLVLRCFSYIQKLDVVNQKLE